MGLDNEGRSTHRDPEALLRRIEAAERAEHRGQLKIFLGYASGVGKSFRLFDEGRRRHERGEDIIVAATQPDYPPEVVQVIHTLEIIPTRDVAASRSSTCQRFSHAVRGPQSTRWATTRRQPARRRGCREELLEAGISVLTSINPASSSNRIRPDSRQDEDRTNAGVHQPCRRSRRRRYRLTAATIKRISLAARQRAAAHGRVVDHQL